MPGKSPKPAKYILHLYISGLTDRSRRAIASVKTICDQHLPGRYNLRVVDILQNPEEMAGHNIIAAPTLIKELPLPVRRIVGDMSDSEKVISRLELSPAA
jgi:circadian clock protein KaiB